MTPVAEQDGDTLAAGLGSAWWTPKRAGEACVLVARSGDEVIGHLQLVETDHRGEDYLPTSRRAAVRGH